MDYIQHSQSPLPISRHQAFLRRASWATPQTLAHTSQLETALGTPDSSPLSALLTSHVPSSSQGPKDSSPRECELCFWEAYLGPQATDFHLPCDRVHMLSPSQALSTMIPVSFDTLSTFWMCQSFKKRRVFMLFSVSEHGEGGSHSLIVSRVPFSHLHPGPNHTLLAHCLCCSYASTESTKWCLLCVLRDTPNSECLILS